MRRLSLTIAALALLAPTTLVADEDLHESYISYDSGETRVVTFDDRELEVGVNSPVLAGDRLLTSRRGRTEVRLADGNLFALDRKSMLTLVSAGESYELESDETVLRLEDGKVIVQERRRSDNGVRVDTRFATYASLGEAIFSVETRSDGDEIAVFGGSVSVRTPDGTWELRTGERVAVDQRGIFDQSGLARDGMDSFERWFMRRTDGSRVRGRYLDDRLAYSEPMLDTYGSWVFVHDYNDWVWRPYVSAGWQPYRSGYWRRGRTGGLIWVSYEPWGWVPYHYGRWAYSSLHGWVWLPGRSYSRAWVYWIHGPNYIGWAPWGLYDCFPDYRGWLYDGRRSLRYASLSHGFGFRGRVNVRAGDLRHWVVVGPNDLLSRRIDRSALAADAIGDRLRRGGTRAVMTDRQGLSGKDLRDPSEAVDRIVRRGGEGTGIEGSGSLPDATRFFRRDPDLSDSERETFRRALTGGSEGAERVTRGARPGGSGEAVSRSPEGGVTSSSGTEVIRRRGTRGTTPTRGVSAERGERVTRTPADSSGQRRTPRTRSGESEVPGRVIDSIERRGRTSPEAGSGSESWRRPSSPTNRRSSTSRTERSSTDAGTSVRRGRESTRSTTRPTRQREATTPERGSSAVRPERGATRSRTVRPERDPSSNESTRSRSSASRPDRSTRSSTRSRSAKPDRSGSSTRSGSSSSTRSRSAEPDRSRSSATRSRSSTSTRSRSTKPDRPRSSTRSRSSSSTSSSRDRSTSSRSKSSGSSSSSSRGKVKRRPDLP